MRTLSILIDRKKLITHMFRVEKMQRLTFFRININKFDIGRSERSIAMRTSQFEQLPQWEQQMDCEGTMRRSFAADS